MCIFYVIPGLGLSSFICVCLFMFCMSCYAPQVPFGGCYRLVDIPMSNCINSGINKIYVLTQFNSQSLNRHIAQTYNLGGCINFGGGFVEVQYCILFLLYFTYLSSCVSLIDMVYTNLKVWFLCTVTLSTDHKLC